MKNMRIRSIALVLAFILLFSLLVGCQGTTNVESLPDEPKKVYDNYVLQIKTSQILPNTDVIVVGTVLSTQSVSVCHKETDYWMTFAKVRVEESLHGSVKPGEIIEVYQNGAPGRQIHTTVEKSGSYFQTGERLVLFLYPMTDLEPGYRYYDSILNEAKSRNAFREIEIYGSALKVDAQGNLSYRFDVEKVYKNNGAGTKPPFYEYETLTELREALPQLLAQPQVPIRVQTEYYLCTTPEEMLRSSDLIAVGTVVELDSQYVRQSNSSKRWMTFVKIKVEETLHGNVERGEVIELALYGAPGKELRSNIEDAGSYPTAGDRLLLFLKLPPRQETNKDDYNPLEKMAEDRNAFSVIFHHYSMMTVDANGNLGYRFDWGEYYEGFKPVFSEYQTVSQLKEALPQLWKDTEEWLALHPFFQNK